MEWTGALCLKDEGDNCVVMSSGRISKTARSHGERFSRELSVQQRRSVQSTISAENQHSPARMNPKDRINFTKAQCSVAIKGACVTFNTFLRFSSNVAFCEMNRIDSSAKHSDTPPVHDCEEQKSITKKDGDTVLGTHRVRACLKGAFVPCGTIFQ
ncbi:hypothetical protein K0M31_004415 [Melipona bicolor]|uniref:Uncharacterized protein n=1 Tax=Melipona bicolor TaxID=60889 RepID=A0AA40FWV1_9HYME|nr:hypothetical protein K0M31_004415 [Melipona bicolor]